MLLLRKWCGNEKKKKTDKKHLENADTSTSMTFDLVVWHWPFVKVKKADVIRCRILYCTLIPGITIYHHKFISCDLWPSSVTFSFCISYCWMFVPKVKFLGSVEFKIWTFVYRTLVWHHYHVITHLILMKCTYKSAKGILSGIPNFTLIKHKRAKMYSGDINREL